MTDFPFDIIFGNNGDASICLPAYESEPEPDAAIVEGTKEGVALVRRSGQRIELEVDKDTRAKILDRESIVIVETDAAEADIRFMYTARISH